jgi:hypothetical protein
LFCLTGLDFTALAGANGKGADLSQVGIHRATEGRGSEEDGANKTLVPGGGAVIPRPLRRAHSGCVLSVVWTNEVFLLQVRFHGLLGVLIFAFTSN